LFKDTVMSDIKSRPSPKGKSKTSDVSSDKMDVASLMALLDRKTSQEQLSNNEIEEARDNIKILEDVEERLKASPAHGRTGRLSNQEDDELNALPEYSFKGDWKKPGVNNNVIIIIVGVILALTAASYFVSKENIEYSDDEIAILRDKKRMDEGEIKTQIPSIAGNKSEGDIKSGTESISTPKATIPAQPTKIQPIVQVRKIITDAEAQRILDILKKD
jgi:hypothetical protein